MEKLDAHLCTLYHTKRQHANIRPRGHDEKPIKITFLLSFLINSSTKIIFFKKKHIKKGGTHDPRNRTTNDERKEFLALNIWVAWHQICVSHQDNYIMTL